MTARDDEDDLDNDPLLSSMRSVFRDMRETDEDPPSRGLDALMAAARTKAAEMQPAPEKESWWRRSFAMLLRPPMLAAATVVVLVGGAVVLSQRGASVQPTTTASSEREKAADSPAAAPARKQRDLADPPPAAGAGSVVAEGVSPPAPTTVKRPVARPPVVREPITSPPATESTTEPSKPEPPKDLGDGEGNLQIAEERPRPTGTKSSVRVPATADADHDAVTLSPTAGRPTAPIEQLVKQAETAAGRNDCAAVRATAARIRKQDVNVYKTRVATQPAIALI